jgi:hypothetical protein
VDYPVAVALKLGSICAFFDGEASSPALIAEGRMRRKIRMLTLLEHLAD